MSTKTRNRKGVRASYREAVAWIAANDEPGLDGESYEDLDGIASQISVLLVADLWRKDPMVVARAVLARRRLGS